jgi:hypothetical protein
MAPDTTPLDPGSMTVPPLFGWEHIVAVLALMAVVAAAFLVLAVTRGQVSGRPDWQAWLDARSNRRTYPADGAPERASEPIHPSRLVIRCPEENDLPRHL